MDDDVRSFGDTLGRTILARDWPATHKLLAPWLQQSLTAEDVREFFENEYKLTLQENGAEEMHYPECPDPDIGGNTFVNATGLREPIEFMNGKVRNVAPEVTDENMKFWMRMQLQCSDEQMETLDFDFFAEVWLAVVETQDGLRVGYWSQGAY